MKKILLPAQLFSLLFCFTAYGQAPPGPLPFVMTGGATYTLTAHNSASFPANMAIGSDNTNADGNFATDIITDAPYGNGAGQWKDNGPNGISFKGSSTAERGSFLLALTTLGRQNITVGWTVIDINAAVNTNYIELQYRVGPAGNFQNLSSDLYQQGSTISPSSFSLQLPAAADNQPLVYIRWIYYEVGSGVRDRLAIDNISVSSAVALPIELSRFDVQKKGSLVELSWETAMELHNDRFVIERSANGADFKALESLPGAGTSSTVQRYHFTDRQPLAGRSYYRLQQVDTDGQFSYSPLRLITMPGAGNIRLFPTLVAGSLNISMAEPSADNQPWSIFSANGRLIRSGIWAAEIAETTLTVNDLPPGSYFFRLAGSTQPFVKQ